MRSLKGHEKLHKNPDLHKCPICQKRFARAAFLKDHLLVHSEEGRKALECRYCKKVGSSIYNMKRHEETCKENENRLLFPCDKCDKVFTQVMQLRKHLILHENP